MQLHANDDQRGSGKELVSLPARKVKNPALPGGVLVILTMHTMICMQMIGVLCDRPVLIRVLDRSRFEVDLVVSRGASVRHVTVE